MVEFLEPNVAVIEGCLAGAGTQGRGSPSLDPCQDAILSASGLRWWRRVSPRHWSARNLGTRFSARRVGAAWGHPVGAWAIREGL